MKDIHAMIISVGGTPEPLVTTISHHRPEYVCFFASQGTVDRTVRVREILGEAAGSIRFEVELVDNENDLLECHEKAARAVQRVRGKGYAKDSVVVDYTGGTKNMSVALALAAVEEGYSFSYVGGERRTKGGVGIVENGHEKVYSNLNPWDYWAVKERRQASLFFNSYQYKPCRTVLVELAANASKSRNMYKKLAAMVDAYYHWDLFRHVDAAELFKKGKPAELAEDDDAAVASFARCCTNSIPRLDAIITASNRGKVPCDEMGLDLYANAERRFAEGKVDDAILRLYRLVEMSAQGRLHHRYGIDTGNVAPDRIPDPVRDEYRQKYQDSRSGKIQIAQSASYQLLNALGDPLGMAFEEHQKEFLDIQSSRNYSYLAHGFKSSQESVYLKLCDFVAAIGCITPDSIPAFPKLEL